MDSFETIMIINPTLTPAETDAILTEVVNILMDNGDGKGIHREDWGTKKLAYPTKGHTSGYYALFRYRALPEGVDAIGERFKKLEEDNYIIKYIIVKNDCDWDDEDDDFINVKPSGKVKSEQKTASKPDALDVLLGFAKY